MQEFLSISEFVEQVIEKTGYLTALEQQHTMEADARIENIQEFISVAKQFEQDRLEEESEDSSLLQFLTDLSLVSDADSDDGDGRMVTLMTLHAAKGLEFPVVFIIGLEEGIFPSLRSIMENSDDFCAKVKKLLQSYNKVHYLCNETYEYLAEDCVTTWTIFGTPDCHIFGNWAFMYDPETETEHFNRMPDNVDIVLSHDACYGRNDVCLETAPWIKPNNHIGNYELLQVVKKKKPLYHFTGHLHSTSHELTDYDGTQTACVSLLDEHYKMNYKLK